MTTTNTKEQFMQGPDTHQTKGRKGAIMGFVTHKISPLQQQLVGGASSARATAARLRRAIGREAGSVPEVWEITLGDLPEELVGRGDAPSYAETAVHHAITLYALHQQSKSETMHVRDRGLGTAVRDLIHRDGMADFENSPVIRRFNALATAGSVEEMAWHLRGIITQLRGAGIPLDYAKLASDLYDFNFEQARDRVRLDWGRQLYAFQKNMNGQKPTKSVPDNQP